MAAMKTASRAMLLVAVLGVSAVAAVGSASAVAVAKVEVTPVQKVIQLMQGMMEKGKKLKHDEQLTFAAYKQFCQDTDADLNRRITKGNEQIDMLSAKIEQDAAKITKLTREIAVIDEDIAFNQDDIKAATKVNGLEEADYAALEKDYSETVDALERAVAVLKKQAFDRKQANASALVQVSSLQDLHLVPEKAKRAIEAFLQEDPVEDAVGLGVTAPEASGYEFRSTGIIEMLEKLRDEFVEEKTQASKTEMDRQHEFTLLMQDLAAQIDTGKKDKKERELARATTQESKIKAEGDLSDTTKTRDDDVRYLSELTSNCETKASEFESRQQLREEELEAIAKAIEIIGSASVKGHGATYLPTMLQKQKKGTSLAALRSEQRSSQSALVHVAQYLSDRARQLDSRLLASLASRAAADPFVKVKTMIKDLIVRLMEEATEEAEHKGWCDTELSTNKQTREEKTMAVEMLHAEIDELETSIAKLTQDIADLTKAVADLDAEMQEATKLREEEKKTNAQTVADAQEAQTAIAQAVTVLKEFYGKASGATALLQGGQAPVYPEVWSTPYQGMQAENGGVLGMLEVVESDFARLEAETKAAEAAAQKAYEQFMNESEVDKAGKNTDIKHKTSKKQGEAEALVTTKTEAEGTQKELDAALLYYDKLKPSCVDSGVNYEDRVARRKEEIQSLKEALKILTSM